MRAGTVLQTEAIIGGVSVVLAHPEDRHQLRQQMQEAVATPGRFVEIEAADGSEVSVLVTPTTPVSFLTRAVEADEARISMTMSMDGTWDLL